MNGSEIKSLREALGLNKQEFASLFDVHPVTITRWEKDEQPPSGYQTALMQKFWKAVGNSDAFNSLGAIIAGAGVLTALFLLLKAAFNDED